ncbi:DUF1272 domain-containing protein [uncultured Paraglaciecola sp.]|jgi:uncharacterized protein|uniref:DUF1272 domain-containing protein n=1 Tax=uncultured Paraglaciecola sp. TaxID=1765024 RepID=UPI0025D15ADC|nr:DUF1272 domain-containing protein [uncultured Paraglaciecola sp.]
MLQLRPNCESCNLDLAADSAAYICTFECTFCENCAVNSHTHICPNCRGNLEKRPIRPKELLDKYPPSTKRVTN